MIAATATPCACPVHCPPEGIEAVQQKAADECLRGLITIDSGGGFRPSSAKSQPEGTIGTNLSKEVALEFAIAFNESAYAHHKSRWAVVTTHGALILLPVDPDHRPPSPWMFHPAVRELTESNHETAQDLAAAENVPRFEQSLVPRVWTLPVMSLKPTWTKREARRAAPKTPGEAAAVADWDAMLACQPNPLADKLVDLYLPVWERIDSDLPYGVCVGGATTVQKDDDGKPFALDNEQLYSEAEIRIDHTLLYDLRGDIEANVAQALRAYAHDLLDGADRLENGKPCRGPYLVIERGRVVAQFNSLAAAGGFAGGYGDHCQLAELVQEEPVAVGGGTEGGADVPA